MAIESAVMLRRVARIACLVLLIGLVLGGAARAQLPISFKPGNPPPVTVGSVLPFSHGTTGQWIQIYSMKVDPLHGNILFLDSAASNLYKLAPNASAPDLVAGPAPSTGSSDCSNLEKAGSYWNAAIAFDKWDNLYITDRYGSAVQFCRVPYNASAGTWTFTTAARWNGPTYKNASGNQVSIPPQDLQVGDDGVTFYVSTSSTNSIYKFTVDESGNVTNVAPMATALEDMVNSLAVDHAGNLFFIENSYDSPSARVNGIRMIPAGSAPIVGSGDGKAEGQLLRVDQGGFNGITGITFDKQGNLYFSMTNNSSYGGDVDGVFMIPNEGTPTTPNVVWDDTIEVAPVSAGFPVLVDPRGLLWIPLGWNTNWAPPGINAPTCDTTSNQTAGATCLDSSILLWKPGAADLGASSVGGPAATKITEYSVSGSGSAVILTAENSFSENDVVLISADASDPLYALNGLSFYVSGVGLSSTSFQISTSALTAGASASSSATATINQAQALYYIFNKDTTVSKFALAQPSGSNFKRADSAPMSNKTATNPVTLCTDGASYPKFSAFQTTTSQYSYCMYYVQLNTTMAGHVQGEVQLLDANNAVIEGSNAYLAGVGQGAAVSVVSSAKIQPIASGLNDPRQVSADLWGNTYVADHALKAIEKYGSGTTSATQGTVIGAGLTGPTGVAVDGVGNVYIGDSGKVIEIPFINGKLASSQQTTIATGFGTGNLSLAVDGLGNIFVADQQKGQVVEIPNPQTTLMLAGFPFPQLAASAGFKAPSAIAADSSGNVWVADQGNLWEIGMPFGEATEVLTGGLQSPVTGLAVDPSGSVFVAGSTGLVWIPYNTATGTLNINSQILITGGLGSGSSPALPFGLAVDGSQNLYATYGSGSTAGLAQLGIGGSFDFSSYGEINPNVPFEVDAQILNLGNQPLTLGDASTDQITGTNAANFSLAPATLNSPGCGPTTTTPPGGSCYLGMILQSPTAGVNTAAVAVLSNAANASAGVNIAMSGNVVQDFRPATQVAIAPIGDVVYPGSVTVKVTVAATDATYGMPSGTVTLSVGSANGNQPKQTLALDSTGTATFSYTNLLGGSYNVNANYDGEGTAGGTQNTCTPAGTACFAGGASKTTFKVSPATPAYALGPPVSNSSCLSWAGNGSNGNSCTPDPTKVTAWAGNTFVQVGKPIWILASVTSTVGTPSGTVTFLQNGHPVDPGQGVNGAIALNGNGVATFSLQNLPKGAYSLTAVYSGDVNYAAQTFQLPSFYVIIPSVQITQATSAGVSITAGTPMQVNLSLMPLVGFSGDVALECNSSDAPVAVADTATRLPVYTQCTFAYANTVRGTSPVGSSGSVASNIVVTISTNVPVNGGTSAAVTNRLNWSFTGLFGLGLLGLIAARKRASRYLTLICLGAVMSGALMGITSCTNAGYSTPPPAPKVKTPAGTYNVQIITYDPNGLKQTSLSNPVFTLPITVQ